MKHNITEQDLLDFGFVKNMVSAEESGDKPYYYFTLDKNETSIMISCANDETVNGFYEIEFFHDPDLGKIIERPLLLDFVNCFYRL